MYPFQAKAVLHENVSVPPELENDLQAAAEKNRKLEEQLKRSRKNSSSSEAEDTLNRSFTRVWGGRELNRWW